MSSTQSPISEREIVTLDTLSLFKDELLNSLGITASNKSIIQTENFGTNKISNSIIIGTDNNIELPESENGLKNILVSGQGNIATAWNQTVLGNFNNPNTEALFIIGTGIGSNKRKNSFEVLKNGTIKFYNTEITTNTNNQLQFNSKLSYSEDQLLDLPLDTSWQVLKNKINTLTDSELIPAGVIKNIIKFIDVNKSLNPTEVDSWRNNLVQNLDYNGEDKTEKALSVAAAQELMDKISDLENDTHIANFYNDLNTLKDHLIYLIKSLTVDKISNDAYRNKETDELIECYAVGLADYALDADTKFTLVTNNSQEQEENE